MVYLDKHLILSAMGTLGAVMVVWGFADLSRAKIGRISLDGAPVSFFLSVVGELATGALLIGVTVLLLGHPIA